MTNWKEYKVEEFAEVIGGGTPSTKNPDYFGGSIPWVTPRDLTNYEKKFIKNGDRNITKEGLNNSSAKLIPKNSILLTSRAPIGYLAIAENDVTTNQGFKSIVVNPDIADYNFVYYLIKANIERIKGYGTGTTFAEVSATVVKNLKFNLPDLPTQTAIAEILSSLDDKIELNNNINKELENLAQALFKQWFINFEFPNENGEPYKSSGGEMVDSELGYIPVGWEVTSLTSLLELIIDYRGKTPLKLGMNWSDIGIKAISARNVKSRSLTNLDNVHIGSQELYDIWMKDKLKFGDVLLTSEAPLGETAILLERHNFILSQRLFALRANKKISPYYLFEYLSSDTGINELERRQSGSTVVGIKQKELLQIKLLSPSLEIIKQHSALVSDIYKSIENNDIENQELTKLRDTLLPKLISGELEVAEVMAETA